MYFPAMAGLFRETEFLTNLYATPADWQRDLFYSVVRAGHLKAGFEHRIQRETYPGHELILCLEGRGWVQVAGKRHEVKKGELVWVNCHHPHAYGCIVEQPWELYWIRVEGATLDRIARLLDVSGHPVHENLDVTAAALEFERVFHHMDGRRPSDAAVCHAAVGEIISQLFSERLNDPRMLHPKVPPQIVKALEKMRLYYHESIRVQDLAETANMSESHFSRQFKAAIGTSPIDWLRKERINQAKRRLIESDDPIKEIARQVGYSDQFFFSKDFKKTTQLTPTEFRMKERQP